jgi:hypothetical protein
MMVYQEKIAPPWALPSPSEPADVLHWNPQGSSWCGTPTRIAIVPTCTSP